MAAKLISSGMDTDAQMARLLEVTVKPSPLFTKDSEAGRKVYDFLNSTYGHVGRAFIKNLLELGPSALKTIIADANATFANRYDCKFAGEERYWEQAIILADLAGKLAKDWGLIKFDHVRGITWVLDQMGAIRKTAQESKVDAFDLLGEYLNDTASSALAVFHQGDQKPTIDYSRLPRSSIHVRFDLHRKTIGDHFDHGIVMLDRAHFRKWLSARGGDYKSFIQELTEEGIIATPKSQKAYLGKDSPIKLGQTYVIGINLNHPRLQGILDKESQNAEDLALGQLKALT